MQIKIEIDTKIYNEKRYSKPWIAKVDLMENGRMVFTFGAWIKPIPDSIFVMPGIAGDSGKLVLHAKPGEIIARGQKDSVQLKNNFTRYYLVQDSGELIEISKVEAYKKLKEAESA